MIHGLISLLAALLLGFAATFYLRKVRLPRDETAAGIAALAAMSWRDFINLVLAALGRRGFVRVFEHEAARDDSEYILERGGERWLLSCKHGSAFILGQAAVNEIADAVRVHGAAGGLLLTQGRISTGARPIAALQRIELLDGPTLWPEVRELISDAQHAVLHAEAEQRARRHTFYAWIAAIALGIGLFVVLPRDAAQPVPAMATASTAAQPTAPPALATTPASVTPPATATVATPADTLEQQRIDVARAISTLPMVDRAVWSTQSTLQVYLLNTETDAMLGICPLLERYSALAASRVQLTPPVGSQAAVRFRQCRAY